MTTTEATGRNWFRGRQLALALFATSVALTAGGQALTPAPAAAMINEGEECADPNYPSIECETTGGVGGAGSGGGTAGPEGGGGGDTVGPVEVIQVEGKVPDETPAPSPCGKNCLPAQLGGRHGPGGDGIGQKSPGKHGGKPTKVAKAPKKADEESGDPSLEDCRALMAGALALSLDSYIQGHSAAIAASNNRVSALLAQRRALEAEASELSDSSYALGPLTKAIDSVNQQIYVLRSSSFLWATQLQRLRDQRDGELRRLRRECQSLYGGKLLPAE